MRIARLAPLLAPVRRIPLAPLAVSLAVTACGSVPDDPGGPNGRVFATGGVIEGTVVYQGPRPCSMNGHIVGAALMLVFDRANPPPPNGLGTTVVNFADVIGDTLFADEPRYTGSTMYCPAASGFTETITASAPFAIAPVAAGSYVIQAFYDSTGDFLPSFKFRDLPEMGDVGGGDIDTANALLPVNAGNPNYQAHFLEVDVGVPEPLPDSGLPPNSVPSYTLPPSGYVASNVSVSIGQVLPTTRPYFYPQGMTTALSSDGRTITDVVVQSADVADTSDAGIAHTVETDPSYMPILTIPQDIQAYSAPGPSSENANLFESALPHLRLQFGVANPPPPTLSELLVAIAQPFHFQLLPTAAGSNTGEGAFFVWQNAIFNPLQQAWNPMVIPEGQGVPQLWPVVILSKLIDDPGHVLDPASLTAQGSAAAPAVIIQGITLLQAPQTNPFGPAPDTLFNSVLAGGAVLPSTLFTPDAGPENAGVPVVYPQSELTVALRPSAICFGHLFDGSVDNRGVLVTPYQLGPVATFSASGPPTTLGPIVPPDLLDNSQIYASGAMPARAQITSLVKGVQYGCLPTGRYEINVVYPDGQAWTVPNEAGACTAAEGATNYTASPPTCTLQPRPVLRSQGTRAVVEITATTNPSNCVTQSPPVTTDLTSVVVAAGSPPPQVPADCCVPGSPMPGCQGGPSP